MTNGHPRSEMPRAYADTPQLPAGDPPDVHMTPHIGHIGWLDFHRAEEAIAAGKAATETALEPIEATIAALA